MKMYSDLLLPNVVSSSITCDQLQVEKDTVPALDAVVTQSDDRTRTAIALINRHPENPARWQLKLDPQVNPVGATITVLSGESPDAYNDVAHPDRVVPETRPLVLRDGLIEVPPHSVAVAQFTS